MMPCSGLRSVPEARTWPFGASESLARLAAGIPLVRIPDLIMLGRRACQSAAWVRPAASSGRAGQGAQPASASLRAALGAAWPPGPLAPWPGPTEPLWHWQPASSGSSPSRLRSSPLARHPPVPTVGREEGKSRAAASMSRPGPSASAAGSRCARHFEGGPYSGYVLVPPPPPLRDIPPPRSAPSTST